MRAIARRLAVAIAMIATLMVSVGAAPVLDADAAEQHVHHMPHHVLALGDSVPAGTACACSPFPAEYASLLSHQSGVPVTVDNEAVNGLDTTGLLAQLRQPGIADAVRRADVLVLTVGANDFAAVQGRVVRGRCALGSPKDCTSSTMAALGVNLAAALTDIRALRAGKPTTVLVTGYWNVFQDGRVARQAAGTTGLEASRQLTLRVNETIKAVSASAGASYVDLFEPFQRPGADIDSLLAADGDHPDASGHELIAAELLQVGLPGLS